MGLQEVFQRLWQAAEHNRPETWEVEIADAIFYRHFRSKERLLLLGGGHIAQPLCTFASALDFSVTVVDDRPSFANTQRFPEAEWVICESFPQAIRQFAVTENDDVAVITRGHRWDADCLRAVLSGPYPRYLGLIGSRRRTGGLLEQLEQEGVSRPLLEGIHTPIGLDIGALTTKEISISILAELIACRRAETGRRSKRNWLVSEDVDKELLRMAADPKRKKALLLVYETHGSTPVKSGAWMVVDQNFQTAGTIGGGCSENALLHTAYRLIGTGRARSISMDLSKDAAEDSGMVCGGKMEVWISDVTA